MKDSPELTHLGPDGAPRMVDVGSKDPTRRRAVAAGGLRMSQEAFEALKSGAGPKGDALQVAALAGIMAGKRTGDLIPLCHVLPGASVAVDLTFDPDLPGVSAVAEATFSGKTGVEMEALVAATIALLTVYDMAKAIDKGMVLHQVQLVSKAGGKSGDWSRD